MLHGDQPLKSVARWQKPPQANDASHCPTARCAHTCTEILGLVYLFGGWNGSRMLNDLHIFSYETMTWSRPPTAGLPPKPRAGHSAVAVGRKLYIFGGGDGENYLNDLVALDVETMAWTAVVPSGVGPSPRSRHTATAVGSKIYFIGGGGDAHVFADVFILDTDHSAWSSPALTGPPFAPRWGHTTVLLPPLAPVPAHPDALLGFTSAGDTVAVGPAPGRRGDLDSPASRPRPGSHPMLDKRSFAELASHPLLIVFGGHDGTAMVNTMHVLDCVSGRWWEIPQFACPPSQPVPRAGHMACCFLYDQIESQWLLGPPQASGTVPPGEDPSTVLTRSSIAAAAAAAAAAAGISAAAKPEQRARQKAAVELQTQQMKELLGQDVSSLEDAVSIAGRTLSPPFMQSSTFIAIPHVDRLSPSLPREPPTVVANGPMGVGRETSCVTNGAMIIFGGGDGHRIFADVWVLDLRKFLKLLSLSLMPLPPATATAAPASEAAPLPTQPAEALVAEEADDDLDGRPRALSTVSAGPLTSAFNALLAPSSTLKAVLAQAVGGKQTPPAADENPAAGASTVPLPAATSIKAPPPPATGPTPNLAQYQSIWRRAVMKGNSPTPRCAHSGWLRGGTTSLSASSPGSHMPSTMFVSAGSDGDKRYKDLFLLDIDALLTIARPEAPSSAATNPSPASATPTAPAPNGHVFSTSPPAPTTPGREKGGSTSPTVGRGEKDRPVSDQRSAADKDRSDKDRQRLTLSSSGTQPTANSSAMPTGGPMSTGSRANSRQGLVTSGGLSPARNGNNATAAASNPTATSTTAANPGPSTAAPPSTNPQAHSQPPAINIRAPTNPLLGYEELRAWLQRMGMGKYFEKFVAEEVDMSVLPSLTEAHLTAMGIASLGARLKILAAVKHLPSLHQAHVPQASSPPHFGPGRAHHSPPPILPPWRSVQLPPLSIPPSSMGEAYGPPGFGLPSPVGPGPYGPPVFPPPYGPPLSPPLYGPPPPMVGDAYDPYGAVHQQLRKLEQILESAAHSLSATASTLFSALGANYPPNFAPHGPLEFTSGPPPAPPLPLPTQGGVFLPRPTSPPPPGYPSSLPSFPPQGIAGQISLAPPPPPPLPPVQSLEKSDQRRRRRRASAANPQGTATAAAAALSNPSTPAI